MTLCLFDSCVGAELSIIEALSGNRIGEPTNESETVCLNIPCDRKVAVEDTRQKYANFEFEDGIGILPLKLMEKY